MSKRSKKPGSILKEDPHNYGIDLLRCLSMLMIIVLHIYNQGGALTAINIAAPKSWQYYLSWVVQFLCLGSVNLYGMISGYVMLHTSFKPRRFFSLWLQVTVTALLICTVTQVFFSEDMLKSYWIASALPVSQRLYWYFTCYTGVFLLSPLVNRGIRALTDRQAVSLLIGCVVLFCVIACIGYSYHGDAFYLVGGYSVLWLVVLYVIGACLKKTGILTRVSGWKLFLTMLLCIVLSFIWRFDKQLTFLSTSKKCADKFINPFLVVLDICLFALFARAKIRGSFVKKLLRFIAPLTFSVYLLHVHPIVWAFLKDRMRFVAGFPAWTQIPAILGFALAVFIACILIDWLRVLLFRLLRVDKLCAWAEKVLRKCAERISRYLLKRT